MSPVKAVIKAEIEEASSAGPRDVVPAEFGFFKSNVGGPRPIRTFREDRPRR
jgi:hypothetical protein